MTNLGDMEIEIRIDPRTAEAIHKNMEDTMRLLTLAVGNSAISVQQLAYELVANFPVSPYAVANYIEMLEREKARQVAVSYTKMNDDWFEVKTFADPTHIEMRRLSDEEAEQAQKEYEQQYAERIAAMLRFYHPEWFEDTNQPVMDFAAVSDALTALPDKSAVDKKAVARARSKADVDKKRKAMMKRRKL